MRSYRRQKKNEQQKINHEIDASFTLHRRSVEWENIDFPDGMKYSFAHVQTYVLAGA